MGTFAHNQVSKEQPGLLTTPSAGQKDISPVASNVASSLKIYDMFNYCVETLLCVLKASAAYIYLYDDVQERLVLAQMNAFYSDVSKTNRQALAEGIAGVVALTKEAILSERDLKLEQYYPLHELQRPPESVIALPILTEQGQLLGVVSAHSEKPDAFSLYHQRYLGFAAALLANQLSGTEIYKEAEHIRHEQDKQQFLAILAELTKINNSNLPLDELLKAQARQAQKILGVDLCLILLANQQAGQFTVRASSQPLERAESYVHAIKIRPELWSQISAFFETNKLPRLHPHQLDELNPLENVSYVTLLPIPLTREGEPPALLLCYTSRQRDYTQADQIILEIIANQLNLTLKHQRITATLEHRQIAKTFLHDLLTANTNQPEILDTLKRRASFFNYDLSRPHRLLLIEFSQTATTQPNRQLHEAVALMESALLQRDPTILLAEAENRVRALVPETPGFQLAELKIWFSKLVQDLEIEQHCNIQVGISRVCAGITEFQRGNTEASEALKVGFGLQKQGVLSFDELGGLRYLQQFAQTAGPVDRYQELVINLVQYDSQKPNSDLLNTLETFIEKGGNLTDTSDALEIHRNTLIQRLKHIQSMYHKSEDNAHDGGIRDPHNWFPLMGALKTYRLTSASPKNRLL